MDVRMVADNLNTAHGDSSVRITPDAALWAVCLCAVLLGMMA